MELSTQQLESLRAEAEAAGVLDAYLERLTAGVSPRMAMMLVMQRFPGVNGTDAKFNKLQRQQMANDYADGTQERILKIAKRAGIATAGKTYNGALGKYDDPLAWVSDTHDVRRAAKSKGLTISGQVNATNPAKPRATLPRLSDTLIAETAMEYIDADPVLREKVQKNPKKEIPALREKIVDKHAPKPR